MAENTRPPPTGPRAEAAIRIIWAAHILRYLGGDCYHPRSDPVTERSQALGIPQDQQDADSESQGSDLDENDALDADSERAATLSGFETHEQRCKSKFLDALAELLSPSKGWEYVTATSLQEQNTVTITVARNDGFGSRSDRSDGSRCRDLVDKLGAYLSADDTGSPGMGALPDFEVAMIEHNSDRVQQWLDSIRRNVEGVHTAGNTLRQVDPEGLEPAQCQWDAFCSTILEGEWSKGIHETTVVSEAYSLCRLLHFRAFLSHRFGGERGEKLWRCVRLLGRPLSNCRLLQSIAKQLPQFRHLQVRVLSPYPPMTTLDRRSRAVNITTALHNLVGVRFKDLDSSAISKLQQGFGAKFLEDCAKGRSFSQHAEIQLLQHHWDTATWPTLGYLGCSKKTCLMCEEFLSALDSPISTRGRHGVCYPAWGVPKSTSSSVSLALQALEMSLVSKIMNLLCQPTTQKATPHNVPQSTVVSSVPNAADELTKRKLQKEHAAEEESLRQKHEIM